MLGSYGMINEVFLATLGQISLKGPKLVQPVTFFWLRFALDSKSNFLSSKKFVFSIEASLFQIKVWSKPD